MRKANARDGLRVATEGGNQVGPRHADVLRAGTYGHAHLAEPLNGAFKQDVHISWVIARMMPWR